MFNLLLFCLVSVLIITPCGYFLIRNNELSINNFSKQLIFGSIIISFLCLLINFILPINKPVSTILLIFPLYFLYKKKSLFFSSKFIFFLIINSFIIFLLVAKSKIFMPDAILYHLQYTSIINDQKIILGLSNLHFRFAHISVMQYFSAFFNNYIFAEKGIILSSAIIASSVIVNFISQIYNYLKNKKFNFHFFFLFLIFIFIVYKMNRFSEYGNDAPTHFLFFFLISEIIKSLDNKDLDFSNNFFLAVFIIMNKLTMAFAILLPFINYKKLSVKNFKSYKVLFIGSFLFLWLIKNILVSGCIVYPEPRLCLKNIPWVDLKTTKEVKTENQAWTRGWPDYDGKITYEDYNKNFKLWIQTWYQGHFKSKILSIIAPYIILTLIIYLFFKFSSDKNKKITTKENNKFILLNIVLLFFTFIWILTVPVYRYGYSYLISFISAFFSLQIIKIKLDVIKVSKFINFFIIICFFVFVGKNSLRIFEKNKKEIWPKITFLKKENVKKIELSNISYFESLAMCGYGNSPCTHISNLQLKSTKILNYKVIIKQRSD